MMLIDKKTWQRRPSMSILADTLWSVLTNPTIAYLLLIAGVWAAVMAASIPGTGLPEGAAIICLALAAVGLVQLQASLAGLGLIGLALVLFLLEFRLFAHGALLAGGTVALIVGSLLLFRPDSQGAATLSWVTVLLVSLASTAAFAFFVYRGLGAQKLPVLQDPNRVVGVFGVAHTEVNAGGTVYAAGEEWSAYADERIAEGSRVTVIAREGLRIKVAPAGKVQARIWRPTPL
jgi:membrane-bound serine protease (ClpP class)